MSDTGADFHLLHAWLAGRSIARGLPAPVPEHGGFRVDTSSEAEVRRWVFPSMGDGLINLARSITLPRHFVKLCGEADELLSVLPTGWQLHEPHYFMRTHALPVERTLAAGYAMEIIRKGAVVEVRVTTDSGALAASGYSAETPEAFIYDRIVTSPEHGRRGLGSAVMAALARARRYPDIPQLLVATDDGHALYTSLGWETLSPYATASIGDS